MNTLDMLEKRWRNATRIMFRRELPNLRDYLPWLRELVEPNLIRKSILSGKEVAYAIKEYAPDSKWISLDETALVKNEPLDINEIKDLDSLMEAMRERAYYAGNIVLGNSGNVEKSSNITNSFFMHECSMLSDCRYLTNCSTGRTCQDSFGTYGPGETDFCIRCTQTYRDRRCFELWVSQNCSDCYYSYNIDGCTDCMFCFNVKNKKNAVGNLELGRSRYAAVRDKLVEDMANELEQKKRLPSLMSLFGSRPLSQPRLAVAEEAKPWEGLAGKDAAEEGFGKTTRLLRGRELKDIDDYRDWLERHTRRIEKRESAVSGRRILTVPDAISILEVPKARTVTTAEALEIGRSTRIGEKDAEKLSLSNAGKLLDALAFFNVEFSGGNNSNMTECVTFIDDSDSYRSSAMVYSKCCGYTFTPGAASMCSDATQFLIRPSA
ncbi:MAG: hypothetical protein PHS02_04075 [Candidatus ainarchaeum sp.]|nr:hypothetical protein [Candidatus ainarchaeum sp.]